MSPVPAAPLLLGTDFPVMARVDCVRDVDRKGVTMTLTVTDQNGISVGVQLPLTEAQEGRVKEWGILLARANNP